MSELSVGTLSGLAANSYVVDIASGSSLDLTNAKASSLPKTALIESTGLVHISTVDFSAVALQRLNNVFTSAYDNYEILVNLSASALVSVALRFSSAGTDNTTASSYTRQRILSAAPSTLNTATFSGDGYFTNDADTTAPTVMKFTVYGPALAQVTGVLHQAYVNASADVVITTGGFHSVASAFDGFSLTASSDTITGTVSVYGYGKS